MERLRERVVEEDRGYDTLCWIWRGAKNRKGYGYIQEREVTRRPRRVFTHRVTYFDSHGKDAIPEGFQIDHLCRVRECCNPDHLQVVTTRENSRRGLRGMLAGQCRQGHPWIPENTYYRSNGTRQCRACALDRYRRQRAEVAA